jgi:hypothetical protein
MVKRLFAVPDCEPVRRGPHVTEIAQDKSIKDRADTGFIPLRKNFLSRRINPHRRRSGTGTNQHFGGWL